MSKRRKLFSFCGYNKKCLLLPVISTTIFILTAVYYTSDIRNDALLPCANEMQNSSLSLKSYPTQVADWIIFCSQIAPLIILDPEYLQCLDANGRLRNSNQLTGIYRFAIRINDQNQSEAKSALHKMAQDSMPLGWRSGDVQNRDTAMILKNANFNVFVSILEERPNYWYLHGTKNSSIRSRESPRGFLGLNLKKFQLVHQNATYVFIPTPIDFYIWQEPRSTFLECNRSSAEYCRRQYPDIYAQTPRINISFVEILSYCRDLFLKHRITIMLAGGTQLGWYRECGIIPHTTDTDMTYLASEWKPELELVLQRDKVLKLYWILGKANDGYELTVYNGDTKLDLNALYQEKNRSYIGNVDPRTRRKLRWWYPRYVGACTADLGGHLFYVRCDVVESLTMAYGPEWYEHHHSDKFVWHSSLKNVEHVGTYKKSEWRSVFRKFTGLHFRKRH